MEINSINAAKFAEIFLAGAANLEAKKEWINELNVFPVPDGDMGTNMSMTILSAAKAVSALENPTMKTLAKAISSGSLRGARGNSGVILSQLFRGFSKVIAEHDTITVSVAARAMEKAVETAYKAVMKPKEGTILTVAKGAARKAAELAETTDDVEVLRGALFSLQGKEIRLDIQSATQAGAVSASGSSYIDAQANQEITFTYCTQFLVMLKKPFSERKEREFKSYLEEIGDSIVVVADDEIVKVHVHTSDPGLAMQKGLKYGDLTTIIIENMRLERDEKISAMKEKEMQGVKAEALEPAVPKEPEKEMGFVAVSIGEGLNEIFRGLGADYIIEGGQTMNPSTEDVLKAVEQVNAKTVFILPNNKNIILAANQAVSLCEEKNIIVIPTTTIPQGITALVNYIPDQTPKENESHMKAEIDLVRTGQVTYAVRDTEIDDKKIHQGDYMGIGDKTILSVGKDRKTVALDMMEQLLDEESALLSIYYGEEGSKEEAMEFSKLLTAKYPDLEVEINSGGQPIYYYVVSVE